ncbi:MAG: nucleotidyltransferase [Kiritimatiellia bacterium]
MELNKDFKEFLELLNKHDVDYMVVGGFALAFHGAPRYTGDIDIWIRSDQENADLLIQALHEFGFSLPDLTAEDFCEPDQIVQLGLPPVRIDLLTSISGVTWTEAYSDIMREMFQGIHIPFIGKKAYLKNKHASGRPKDLADIDSLDEL